VVSRGVHRYETKKKKWSKKKGIPNTLSMYKHVFAFGRTTYIMHSEEQQYKIKFYFEAMDFICLFTKILYNDRILWGRRTRIITTKCN